MKPRMHALGCSVMRDSHAKGVRIYRYLQSQPVISRGFRPNLTMAPTLLICWKGSGGNQPFTWSIMNKTQAAAVNLCPASADGAALYCTQARPLPVSLWLSISFRPVIRSPLEVRPNPRIQFYFAAKNQKFCSARKIRAIRRQKNWLVCLPHEVSATRNFLGPGSKKHLVRRRVKVL